MDFSLFYFADDSTPEGDAGRYELLLEGARFADRHGFRAVWTPERHFHPFGGLYPNPSVVGAALAMVTSTVAIRAGSVVAPLHHPLRIAEEWSVVDNLSGGRAGVSLASGWHPVDFALSQVPYEDRKRRLTDSIEQLRGLWRGEAHEVVDGNGAPATVRIFPPPVQRELPLWVTSAGDAETFRSAASARAGVLTHLLHQDVDELAAKIAEYRRTARAAHPGWDGHVVLMLHTFLGADRDEVRATVDGPLRAYLRSSVHLIARSFKALDPDFDIDALEDEDLDFLVAQSFDTYFEQRGLFGTVEEATATVERLRGIGVDEIACLIDYGIGTKTVLDGLRHLNALREAFAVN
ncbi:LLM class flavin-dependent oxidoreductase [Streptomyces sp. NBC_00654]|uniref:MupA/Atu3671 family FMN-dependent luciferase-like monooxygenase n=1 Tax=Streptomyces sp. NBC_00654 TaxID=2975799 RepID=UPI00224E3113|nr:MupA/Atu3671 family FMN-dependent luciferase-like monooxygenase [Streptomyces sp. NBC_00654]MCX4967285.1 LLM class flavin-dependent oxidoreductase [Streptomyces sp. NBC_00654]